MISEEKRVVFVHIPKCASISVRTALASCSFRTFVMPRDAPWSEYAPGRATQLARALPPELWNRSFKFAVCRNPYDRLVSGWRHGREQGTVQVPFDYFVRNLETFQSGWILWHCALPQKHHLLVDGEPVVDRICRLEQLDTDLDPIRERIGCPELRVPHLNRTTREPAATYYTTEIQDIVFERFQCDFEYFGYDYEL